jgi:hypothetical protein
MNGTPITPTSGVVRSPAEPSPAAERMRRHRQRRRADVLWLGLELRRSEVDALVRKGLLLEESRRDPYAVMQALYAFLERELECAP